MTCESWIQLYLKHVIFPWTFQFHKPRDFL